MLNRTEESFTHSSLEKTLNLKLLRVVFSLFLKYSSFASEK